MKLRFLLALPLLLLLSCTPDERGNRPNIVLIMADDLGWGDLGCYGHPHLRTPHLDRLAAEGMRFTHAFLTTSSCSPSRASILTGRYPHNTDAEELHWPLPAEQTIFTETLREAGYWTGAAGKWHLGEAMRNRFDRIRGLNASAPQYLNGAPVEGSDEPNETNDKSGCQEWIPLLRDRPQNQPFFVWLAAVDPHRGYEQGTLDPPHQPSDAQIPPYQPDTPSVREDYALYYDEVGRLDTYVGKVMAELEAQGVADNTIILFLSDNGRPFPRDKTTLYDSGIRTPLLVRGPGVKSGTVCESLVSSIDLAPTLLEWAGRGKLDTMQGVSVTSLLNDPTGHIRRFIHAEKNWHDYEDHSRAVRDLRFKYIRNDFNDLPGTPPADAVRSPTFRGMMELEQSGQLTPAQRISILVPRPREELYDTEADPHEIQNLAEDPNYTNTLRQFRETLAEWEARTSDRVPTLRTADEFDRRTGEPLPNRMTPRKSKKQMIEAGLAAP